MIVLEEIDSGMISDAWMTIDLPLDRPLNPIEQKVEEHLLKTFDFYEFARALQEAKKLKENRSAYFQSLYHEISVGSSVWGDACEREWKDISTHGQAYYILNAKSFYDRRIKKLERQYKVWRRALKVLNAEERALMRKYYEGGYIVLSGEVYDRIEEIKQKINTKVFESYGVN